VTAEAPYFTQRDAVALYQRLAGRCDAIFRACGSLALAAADPATTVVLATLSRRAGLHAEAWTGLVPESVLLADVRAAAAADPVEPPDVDGLPAYLRTLQEDLAGLLSRTSPIADEPARRLARAVLGDLDEALQALERRPSG
jgi:hypothetical protein